MTSPKIFNFEYFYALKSKSSSRYSSINLLIEVDFRVLTFSDCWCLDSSSCSMNIFSFVYSNCRGSNLATWWFYLYF